MALRTLDNEEWKYINNQVEEINSLNITASYADVKAFNYDWRQLSAKLQEVINQYKVIIETEERYKDVEEKALKNV